MRRITTDSLLFDFPRDSRRPLDLLRRLLRYPYALVRDLLRGDLNLRATGLVFSTLLSIIPLIAFSFAVLKGLGFHRDLEPLLYEFFRPLGKQATGLTEQVMGFVERTQGGVLGSLGLALLVWTVAGTVQKIEEALNWIWRVERPRSLARRLSDYFGIIVLGPVLLVSLLGLFSAIDNALPWQAWARSTWTMALHRGLVSAEPLVVVTVVLTAIYQWLPNTRIRWRHALVGALLAGAAWSACGTAFARLAVYSTQMLAIYAGFALVLLVLGWLWLNWLILLLGAQLSFYLQHPSDLRHGNLELRPTARLQERLALSTLWLVAEAFMRGRSEAQDNDHRKGRGKAHGWRAMDLAERFDVPGSVLAPVIDALVEHQLIVETADDRLLPARDLGQLRLQDALTAVRLGRQEDERLLRKAHTLPAADRFADAVEEAVERALDQRTLRELLETAAGDAASEP
jgi:membrane protein